MAGTKRRSSQGAAIGWRTFGCKHQLWIAGFLPGIFVARVARLGLYLADGFGFVAL
ncbi:hypothetical protein BQ8794_90200 [Mesorhizobium prunaredense]|uniref:Uncharacterized protein n=1 Tax=Mesorhizobium prunaredense TaxID=1631249 RepID=A0A1R3VJL6_9HYPH|nr:hypothetical protein BQ8794_90200 [Mesorhizobium prunaredense]